MTLAADPPRRQDRATAARQTLLDTAERLFAERGYFGASVRDIIQAANMRLASVNYYFGSKEGLFGEVVRRRAAIINVDRLASLEAALYAPPGEGDRLTDIVEAYAAPMIARCLDGGADWTRYFVLIAQLNTLPYAAPQAALGAFDEVALAYIDAFASLSPGVTRSQAFAAYHFMTGAVAFVVCENRQLDRLSGGDFDAGDLTALSASLVAWLAGGTRACLGLD